MIANPTSVSTATMYSCSSLFISLPSTLFKRSVQTQANSEAFRALALHTCVKQNLLTVATKISKCVYTIKLQYNPMPRTQTLIESITYCATIDLFVQHGIESFQTSATRIAFESERDRFFALLYLSASSSFTPVLVD